MNLVSRLKQFVMRYPVNSRTAGSWLLSRTSYDYKAAVGDGSGSSLIMACCLWISRTFPEAPLRIQQMDKAGLSKVIPIHPLSSLISNPNPQYTGTTLWMATLVDFHLFGNAYWIKIRSATNKVVQLWWVPATIIEPHWPEDDLTTYIDYYNYYPESKSKPIKIPPEDVVHLRYGLDPKNTRKGLSPLASVLREVFTDDEAANFAASLLRNLGVPGVVISPGDADQEASEQDVEDVKDTFMRRFGGDKRGEPLVLRTKTDVKVLSFSPQQMDLRNLRIIPEERVTSVLGLPAIVVGFGAGLDRSTFANFAEAREAAYESLMSPLQRLVAEEITQKLLPEFTDDLTFSAYFDTTNVRILQEDLSKKSTRWADMFEKGGCSRREWRQAMGMQATEADDVYRIPRNTLEVPSDKGATHLVDDQLLSRRPAASTEPTPGGKPGPKEYILPPARVLELNGVG